VLGQLSGITGRLSNIEKTTTHGIQAVKISLAAHDRAMQQINSMLNGFEANMRSSSETDVLAAFRTDVETRANASKSSASSVFLRFLCVFGRWIPHLISDLAPQ
ncbi:unnamed protein product, partial [Prorocentrum cordatum]